jgi:hypothetical protein
LLSTDPLLVECNFFGASDHAALALLQGGNETSGFEQAVMGASVEPSVTTAHDFDVKLIQLQIPFVNVCDFQLAIDMSVTTVASFHNKTNSTNEQGARRLPAHYKLP